MNEGYSADFRVHYGAADREMSLKSGVRVKACDIPGLFADRDLRMDLASYRRWVLLGFGRQWADIPNRFVQVVEMLKPVDDLYHPRMI